MVARRELGQLPPTDSLQAALEVYKTEPHTPELVTATWQAMWSDWRTRLARNGVDLEITVPDLDWPQDEIERPTKGVSGRDIHTGMIYYPPEFSGEEGVKRLAVLFPKMRHTDLTHDLSMVHDQDETGWLNAETTERYINVNTTEQQLRDHFGSQGRVGMNRHQYIVLAEFMRPLGTHIDYNAKSRLLGTRMRGNVVEAGITTWGNTGLDIHARSEWFSRGLFDTPHRHPGNTYSDGSLGGRSIRLKPTEANSR